MTRKSVVAQKKDAVVLFNKSHREEILKKIESFQTHTCCDRPVLENNLLELLTDKSVKHLEALKMLGKVVSHLSCTECLSVVVDILLKGLYYSNDSHSISCGLKGVIKNLPAECVPMVVHLVDHGNDHDNHALVISWYAGLLQSELGQQVLSNCSTPLISMNEILKQLLTSSQNACSALEKAELFSQIHLLTKTLLAFLKLPLSTTSSEHKRSILHTLVRVFNLKGLPQEALGNCSNILFSFLLSTHEDWFDIIRARLCDENYPASCLLDEIEQTAVTKLSLCHALLTCLDCSSLLMQKEKGETILGGAILQFLLKSYTGLNDTTQALLAVRLLEQWSRKCLDCLASKENGADLLAREWRAARQQLTDMTSMGLEHQTDAVRHVAKNTFQFFIKTHTFLNDDVNPIIDAAVGMPHFKKSKYTILSCLAQSNLCSRLVTKDASGLAKELFEAGEDSALASQAKEVYQLLMFHDMERNEAWQDRWLNPLLEVIANNTNGTIFESTLIELLQSRPQIVADIKKWYELDRRERMPVYISALLAGKRQGVLLSGSAEHTDTVNVIQKIVGEAIHHSDGKVRLNAVGVIIEGPKTTQLFSTEELECMKRFIDKNMNNSNPGFRQQLCAYIKKFLIKLRDGGTWLLPREDKRETLESYRTLIAWLVDKCLTDLGPGSGFSRRYLCLQFLKSFADVLGLSRNDLITSPLFNLAAVTSLADCLFDSYDVNKEVALELLCSKAFLDIVNEHPEHANLVKMYWESTLGLSQSVRSASTSAACFFFRWMIHFKGLQQRDQAPDCVERFDVEESNRLYVARTLMHILETQVNAAKVNLCLLAVDSPIYGLLSCIRLLLDNLTCKEILREEPWNSLVLDLIRLTYEASAVASPVVTCDSPEGFLPDDVDLKVCSRVSSQALLVCAWRTVKEVALLFGQLSLWSLAVSPAILGQEIILQIGLHLKELLLETKHRGAFEQVYTGFSLLCNALWKSPIESLHRLPEAWLLDVIGDLLDAKRVTKLCATRRSAGLPFLFQAILSPEVEVGRGELFSISLDALLNGATSELAESRLHCLNILRNLYRESRLNQLIGPYIARGLMVAITGFEASDWPERNSSTLLFTALVTRIFGVPRSKTDFHKKNSLTGRMFFQLYSQLYPFLLERLQRATEDIISKKIHLHPALFPVLVLVGRLQPPTGESVVSPFNLEPFVPLVRMCGASPVFKTRQLAAQALMPLLTPSAFARLLPEVIDSIGTSSSSNQLHGDLLQVHHFVKELFYRGEAYEAVSRVLIEKLPQLIYLLKSPSSLVRYEYASILEQLDSKQMLSVSFKNAVAAVCADELSSASNSISIQPFYPLYCEKMAKLLLNTAPLSSANVPRLLDHPMGEVTCAVMEYMIERKLTSDVEMLKPALIATVASEKSTRKSRSLAVQLLGDHAKNATHRLESMLLIYRHSDEDPLRCTALKEAARGVDPTQSCDIFALTELSDHLLEATKLDVQYHHAAVTALSQLKSFLLISLERVDSAKWITFTCNLWTAAFRLLLDDEESVRMSASATVSSLHSNNSTDLHSPVALELALDAFVDLVGKVSPEAAVRCLATLLIDREEHQEIESVAFEKEDNDSYWEPVVYSKLLCSKIEKCLKNTNSALDLEDLAARIESEWGKRGNVRPIEVANAANRSRIAASQLVDTIKFFYITASLSVSNERFAKVHCRICSRIKEFPVLLNNYAMFQLNALVS